MCYHGNNTSTWPTVIHSTVQAYTACIRIYPGIVSDNVGIFGSEFVTQLVQFKHLWGGLLNHKLLTGQKYIYSCGKILPVVGPFTSCRVHVPATSCTVLTTSCGSCAPAHQFMSVVPMYLLGCISCHVYLHRDCLQS